MVTLPPGFNTTLFLFQTNVGTGYPSPTHVNLAEPPAMAATFWWSLCFGGTEDVRNTNKYNIV
jgi:hypothetical protein